MQLLNSEDLKYFYERIVDVYDNIPPFIVGGCKCDLDDGVNMENLEWMNLIMNGWYKHEMEMDCDWILNVKIVWIMFCSVSNMRRQVGYHEGVEITDKWSSVGYIAS